MRQRVAVLAGRRTPFVRAATVARGHDALDLSLHALQGLGVDHALWLMEVEALAWGIVVVNPRIPQMAREVVLRGGLNPSVQAVTVTDNCITGITAIVALARAMADGRADVAIAGGVESMSNPAVLFNQRAARVFLDLASARAMAERARLALRLRPRDFLPDAPSIVEPSTGLSMGEHCELMVKAWAIGREMQDAVALRSHQRAFSATHDGRLGQEIHPLDDIRDDRMIRGDTSLAKLTALKPVFDRSDTGTITAGTSSALTDGAAAVLLVSERRAERAGIAPLAWITDYEFASIAPSHGLLMAPALAVPRLLARHDMTLCDLDVIEMHEAFAGQVLCNLAAWSKGWKEPAVGSVDDQKLNPLGGSLAIGHPFAATGIRLVTTAANELARRGTGRALVSVCGAGATAAALLLERP